MFFESSFRKFLIFPSSREIHVYCLCFKVRSWSYVCRTRSEPSLVDDRFALVRETKHVWQPSYYSPSTIFLSTNIICKNSFFSLWDSQQTDLFIYNLYFEDQLFLVICSRLPRAPVTKCGTSFSLCLSSVLKLLLG